MAQSAYATKELRAERKETKAKPLCLTCGKWPVTKKMGWGGVSLSYCDGCNMEQDSCYCGKEVG